MLKLIKHDLIATKKSFITMILIIFGFCVISPLFTIFQIKSSNSEFTKSIIELMLSTSYLLIVVLTCITIINLFNYLTKSLFSKRGYLTFTLPYKSSTIILSKIITTMIWLILFNLVIYVSSTLMLIEINAIVKSILGDEVYIISSDLIFDLIFYGMSPLDIFINVLLSIVQLLFFIVTYLLSVSLTHSSYIKSTKTSLSALIFVGIIAVASVLDNVISIFMIEINVASTWIYIIKLVLSLIALIVSYILLIDNVNRHLELS